MKNSLFPCFQRIKQEAEQLQINAHVYFFLRRTISMKFRAKTMDWMDEWMDEGWFLSEWKYKQVYKNMLYST